MEISVRKSPAGVCWWVMVNGIFLSAHDRKYEAEQQKNHLERSYGL